MANIKFVALTQAEYAFVLQAQTDTVKKNKLIRAGGPHARGSGDKVYVPAYLIDGLRLEPLEVFP
jgi:hypothetical protein